MGRYKEDPVVRADDWDPDESATLKGTYSFLELERVRMHVGAVVNTGVVTTEEELAAACKRFADIILAAYRSVTLRARGTAYQEGIDRPRVPFTAEALVDEPVETLEWLAQRAVDHVAPLLRLRQTTPEDITPSAKELGRTPDNFRPADPA